MQQQDEVVESRRVYRRELPGAGYVAIDVSDGDPGGLAQHPSERSPRIRVSVERRASEDRRIGHAPPVVAEVVGDTSPPVIGELYRIASDNVELARGLLEWQTRRMKERAAD